VTSSLAVFEAEIFDKIWVETRKKRNMEIKDIFT